MRTAAVAYAIYAFRVLDIEKVWNKRLFLHSVFLFMQTHTCINSVTGKIWATTLGETVMHLPLLTCLPILNMWDLLCLREFYRSLDWKEAFLAIFFSFFLFFYFSPQKWGRFKTGWVNSWHEDSFHRRAWNKLPTNDWAIVSGAFWQTASAKGNWN